MKRIITIVLITIIITVPGQAQEQKTTTAGIKIIKHFEGFRGKAYYCPAGVLTIGYGSTGAHVKPGEIITEYEATILLIKDVKRFEKYISGKIKRKLKWNEFDAMVSFTFNVGYRITKVMQEAMNSGNSDLLVYNISKYNKARIKGILKVLPGLEKRRKTEGILYKDAILIL